MDSPKREPKDYMRRIIAARSMVCKGLICTNVSSKCLLLYYCCNANEKGEFYKSTMEICLETGLAASTVYELNAKWQTWELLKITKHDWRTGEANDYAINLAVLEKASENTQVLKTDRIAKAKAKSAERSRRHREKHHTETSRHHTETSRHHTDS